MLSVGAVPTERVFHKGPSVQIATTQGAKKRLVLEMTTGCHTEQAFAYGTPSDESTELGQITATVNTGAARVKGFK